MVQDFYIQEVRRLEHGEEGAAGEVFDGLLRQHLTACCETLRLPVTERLWRGWHSVLRVLEVPHAQCRVEQAQEVANEFDWLTGAERRRERDDLDPFSRCLLYTPPSPRDRQKSRMPSSA